MSLGEIPSSSVIIYILTFINRVLKDPEILLYVFEEENSLRIGIKLKTESMGMLLPEIDSLINSFYSIMVHRKFGYADFGVVSTQSSYVSTPTEIFNQLDRIVLENLKNNEKRMDWIKFNRMNCFLNMETNALIQPVVYYNPKKSAFSIFGGEVFIGGSYLYESYQNFSDDLSVIHNQDYIALLTLEKLLTSCRDLPGYLKFNIAPQSLINIFHQPNKVDLFCELIQDMGLKPEKIRLEIIEEPYKEDKHFLREVCSFFWNKKITFAVDDFGTGSSSHHLVLDLKEMVKEIKITPVVFEFESKDNQIVFWDNCAFIEYCRQLALHRDATITAEAVSNYDVIEFLMKNQIFSFQTNLFCKKINTDVYKEIFEEMQDIPEATFKKILTNKDTLEEQKKIKNIFQLIKTSK